MQADAVDALITGKIDALIAHERCRIFRQIFGTATEGCHNGKTQQTNRGCEHNEINGDRTIFIA